MKKFSSSDYQQAKELMSTMVAQKGRWLARYKVTVDHPGHVSDNVQNALAVAMRIGGEIDVYAKNLQLGRDDDIEAQIFDPPHSTIQISAGKIKTSDYSTTPSSASFYLDVRTLPLDNVHQERVSALTDLILHRYPFALGEQVALDVLSNEPGTSTDQSSLIARIGQMVTGLSALGFNGGDEGFVLRHAGLQGITLGPGDLAMAHKANEMIKLDSIIQARAQYRKLFYKIAGLDNGNE